MILEHSLGCLVNFKFPVSIPSRDFMILERKGKCIQGIYWRVSIPSRDFMILEPFSTPLFAFLMVSSFNP